MKQFFALLLCAAAVFGLCACSKAPAPPPTVQTAPTTTPTTKPTDPPFLPISVEDNDSAAFLIIGAEKTDHAGMQLQVQCANKTDRALMFSWDMVSVCGYMYDPMWSVEVAAGKVGNSTISLDTFALEKMGITSVDVITFTLRIYNSEDWTEDPIVEKEFTIYPTGLDADTVVFPDRPQAQGQQVLAENENLRFVIEKADDSKPASYRLQVYLENRTDKNLMFSWDLVSVNGKMLDPYWAMAVAAGKKACSEVVFGRTDLEANGITDITEVEFTLTVSDYDNWSAENLLKEVYTYKP